MSEWEWFDRDFYFVNYFLYWKKYASFSQFWCAKPISCRIAENRKRYLNTFFACLILIRFFGFVLLNRFNIWIRFERHVFLFFYISYMPANLLHRSNSSTNRLMYSCQPGRKSPLSSVYINIIEYTLVRTLCCWAIDQYANWVKRNG